ncbi:hypothetical protein Sjap_006418 [Stephania japonica]|uniref:Uncharacterized protein n=1 Tax=Stephania japonica TaxID=461633 RepID=A0AAP0PLY8_9MAGN
MTVEEEKLQWCAYAMWGLWKRRNGFVFKSVSRSPSEVQQVQLFREEATIKSQISFTKQGDALAIYVDVARDPSTRDTGIGWVLVNRIDRVLRAGAAWLGDSPSVAVAKAWALKCRIHNCLDILTLNGLSHMPR